MLDNGFISFQYRGINLRGKNHFTLQSTITQLNKLLIAEQTYHLYIYLGKTN